MGEAGLSIIDGGPLSDEPLMGAQTIGGYLRDVVARHGPAEALVLRSGGMRMVSVPVCQCSRTRPVQSQSGYSSFGTSGGGW